MPGLPRVVILGGGVGAVTAAAALSRGDWRQHYESITVYQQGWRFGGKGASGRGRDGRIEEHGLHIWFGFYENAFRLLREAHEELDALAQAGTPRWALACTSMEDSFQPCTEISLTDHDGCCWSPWTADFFTFDDDRPWADPDPRIPGERPEDWSAVFYASRCLRLAADLSLSLVRSDPHATIVAGPLATATAGTGVIDDLARLLWQGLDGDLRALLNAAAETLDAMAGLAAAQQSVWDAIDPLLRVLDMALELLRREADELVRESDTARRAWYVVDLMLAIVRGVIEDGVLAQDDFGLVDDVEFRDWLRAHGASQETVDCALVRGVVYDLAFAYAGGDPHRPSAAAGTALRGLMRTFFTYRGALMWKMRSGMGDAIFAPYYELLVKRGVEVHFFHRVEAIRAKAGSVEEIEIDVQANVVTNTGPEDFLASPASTSSTVAARRLWPAAPTVGLQPGNATAKAAPAYESWLADRADARVATRILRRGAPGADGFDVVVSGLPIGCVPHIAPDLVAQSPRWKAAVDHVRTVPTQAMQLWLDRTAVQLGGAAAGIVVGGFVEPYDTWADMEHLVAEEDVPGAVTIAYFCNVLADGPMPARGQAAQWLAAQGALVRAQALRFLRQDIGTLWPAGVDPLTGELDWERLVADPALVGEARLDAQYLRANVEPSERYTLSVPGSGVHRIHPGDTGFSNLYVAGDWTACTLDAGCVEAATISGLMAANAVHRAAGDPAAAQTIIGADGP